MNQQLKDRYHARLELKEIEQSARMRAYNEREESDKKEILDYLSTLSVNDVDTNGYWYKFQYRGYRVSFVNQTSRICVTQYKETSDADETEIISKMYIIRHDDLNLYKDLCKEFSYTDFIIDGRAIHGVRKIIESINKENA